MQGRPVRSRAAFIAPKTVMLQKQKCGGEPPISALNPPHVSWRVPVFPAAPLR